jgi:hypothetical protein
MLTFLVIGAQKSGTTWLYYMLKQHPEVAVSEPKEIDFFNRRLNYEKGLEWYYTHFPDACGRKAVGEVAPNYWWTDVDQSEYPELPLMSNVPKLVHRHLPDLKLIVLLRDPVSRAVSAYRHHIRKGRIPRTRRITDCLHRYGIVTIGHYDVHLSNWMKYFSRDEILVLIYEEALSAARRHETLDRVFSHIGVDPTFSPVEQERLYNSPGSGFNRWAERLPGLPQRVARRITPRWLRRSSLFEIIVRDDEIDMLRRHFAAHNRALAQLLGRELPW